MNPKQKMMFKYSILHLIIGLFSILYLNGQVIGPVNGTLLIAGGGKLSDTILMHFIDAAGGNNAPVVVIPTAFRITGIL